MHASVPTFFLLLMRAADASRAVDMFDLRSDDEESQGKFDRLMDEQLDAIRELVAFCHGSGDSVLSQLTSWRHDG